ncbi:MAG: hypothetical protein HRU17_19110 [Polyangiaceae bacterium]|nr:hypothetical protein [Polyangiaceae bacterium]
MILKQIQLDALDKWTEHAWALSGQAERLRIPTSVLLGEALEVCRFAARRQVRHRSPIR